MSFNSETSKYVAKQGDLSSRETSSSRRAQRRSPWQ